MSERKKARGKKKTKGAAAGRAVMCVCGGGAHHFPQQALIRAIIFKVGFKVLARGEVERPPHQNKGERDEGDKVGAVPGSHLWE